MKESGITWEITPDKKVHLVFKNSAEMEVVVEVTPEVVRLFQSLAKALEKYE